GRSVFPCPFCDGFEVADQPLAVFAWSGAGHAMLYQRWSNDIVVFTHGHTIPEETRSTLTTHGMRVETSPVSRLHHQDGKLSSVELRDGTQIARTAGFLAEPHAVPASTLPAELGVERTTNDWGMEHYVADDFGRTKVPGVYVIGDLKRVFGGVSAASHDGYQCAAGIVRDMVFSP